MNTVKWLLNKFFSGRKIGAFFLYVGAFLLIVSLLGMSRQTSLRYPRFIKVALIKGEKEAGFRIKGGYVMTTLSGRKELARSIGSSWISLKAHKNGIMFKDRIFPYNGIKINRLSSGEFVVNGKRLKGELFICLTKEKKLLIINRINLERYLEGVVPFEMDSLKPFEALKAQAVAARTYAFYKMNHPQAKLYDIFDDSSSQVYGGIGKNNMRTNRAIKETEGIIMTFKGKPFLSFYHTSCGGRTELAKNVWKTKERFPRNIRCWYCLENKSEWKLRISYNDFKKLLHMKGYPLKTVRKVKVTKLFYRSRRVREITIYGLRKKLRLKAVTLRSMLGVNKIKSTAFTIKSGRKKILIQGAGWGHGVGMCQVGAIGMARQKYSFKKILRHYYPGIGFNII
ncbi:SpoIID/LytB domain-containing protein [Chlamydiota bacterium]